MKTVEAAFTAALGPKAAERLHINLPSRKPQLWENLPLALARRLRRAWRTRLDPTWAERPLDVSLPTLGLRMNLVPQNSFIDGFLYTFGVYEISGTRLLQNLLRSGMTFVDVGANSGYYTLLAARLVGAEGRVHAFEPVPFLADSLRRNLALNALTNVEVRPVAVAAARGRATLHVSRMSANNGMSSLIAGAAGEAPEALEVDTVTLDEVAAGLGRRIDLVKIDVEGAEELVLRGARALLAGPGAPVIMFESFAVDGLAATLEGLGYEVRRLHYTLRSGIELYRVGERFDDLFVGYEGMNYLAVKKDGGAAGRGAAQVFAEISAQSRARIPGALRWLATWA